MFTLQDATTETPTSNGAAFATLAVTPATEPAEIFTLQNTLQDSTPLIFALTTGDQGNQGIYTINVGANLEIFRVSHSGTPLSPVFADPDLLEYSYNSLSGELIVNVGGLPPEAIALAVSSNLRTKTDVSCSLTIPEFLIRWRVTENVTITDTFGDHSTMSLSFLICAEEREQVFQELCEGTVVTIWRLWRIHSLTFNGVIGESKLTVNLELRDIHAPWGSPSKSPLDQAISFIESGNYVRYRTIESFAQQAGVSYVGGEQPTRVDRSRSTLDFTTFRQVLQEKAIQLRGFIFYGNPNAVEIRTFGEQAIHIIPSCDVMSSVTRSPNMTGSPFQGLKLAHELRNVRLTLDFDAAQEEGSLCLISYRNAQFGQEVLTPSRFNGFVLVRPDADELRNLSLPFDVAGDSGTKERRKTNTFNGTVVSEEIETYGYAYSSLDIYNITGQNNRFIFFANEDPIQFWVLVRREFTIYIFDADGYLTESRTTGFELSRTKQETDNENAIQIRSEAINLGFTGTGDSSPQEALSLFNLSNSFSFNQTIPISRVRRYELSNHRDFFDNIPLTETGEGIVDPKFARRSTTEERSTEVRQDPRNNDEENYPDITVGRVNIQEQEIQITNRGINPRYITKSSAYTSEGTNLTRTQQQRNLTHSSGRPSTHQRLNRFTSFGNEDQIRNYEAFVNNNFWLFTDDAESDFDHYETTISYPTIDDPEVARAIRQTELAIQNSRDSYTVSFQCLYQDIAVGDFVCFLNQKYILFSKTSTFRVVGSRVAATMSVNLGRYVEAPVRLRTTPLVG